MGASQEYILSIKKRILRIGSQMGEKSDLPLPRYLWDIAKSTTKAERLSCIAAIVVLLVCIVLIVYFTVMAKRTVDSVADIAPHEWYITRQMWLARNYTNPDIEAEFAPLKLIIVAHTVSSECTVFKNCAAELRTIQNDYLDGKKYDIPYNFLIGNEGRVYEGRGWNKIGAHTRGYNRCTLGLAFIVPDPLSNHKNLSCFANAKMDLALAEQLRFLARKQLPSPNQCDYREGSTKVTELQLLRAKMLLEEGVRHNYLHSNYHVIGAKDVQDSLSPGTNLYKAIQQWSSFDHNSSYKKKTCEEIYESGNQTSISVQTATLAPTFRNVVKTGNQSIVDT